MAKKDKPEETPTEIKEEPKKEEVKTAEETPATNVDALIVELEKAGISDVQQLEGKLMASSQAGNLANQLGTAREEIAELKKCWQINHQGLVQLRNQKKMIWVN